MEDATTVKTKMWKLLIFETYPNRLPIKVEGTSSLKRLGEIYRYPNPKTPTST